MTYYELIRSLSIEELDKFLLDICKHARKTHAKGQYCKTEIDCAKCLPVFLRSEVKE